MTTLPAGRNMPAMIGRTLRLAVTCGLLLSLGACEETPYPLTRAVAEQGNAEAQFSLGVAYDTGEGVVQDSAEALKWYRLAAEQGHASAQAKVGVTYSDGLSVPQDYAEAVRWFRLAADQGGAEGQFHLGVMYDDGKGVPQDQSEAARWYQLAADQGVTETQYNLGVTYDEGEGVVQDDAEAARQFRLAADQGHASAQFNLGVMYGSGKGVPPDDIEAHMWLNLATAHASEVGARRIRDGTRRRCGSHDPRANRRGPAPRPRVDADRPALVVAPCTLSWWPGFPFVERIAPFLRVRRCGQIQTWSLRKRTRGLSKECRQRCCAPSPGTLTSSEPLFTMWALGPSDLKLCDSS